MLQKISVSNKFCIELIEVLHIKQHNCFKYW